MPWNEKLQVGFVPIDEQHERLVGLLNALAHGVDRGYSRRILGGLLTGLVSYTKYHFQFEEELMERWGTPLAAEHKAEHSALTGRVLEFQLALDENHRDVSDELLLFLRNWLRGHILGTDKELAHELVARGAGQVRRKRFAVLDQ